MKKAILATIFIIIIGFACFLFYKQRSIKITYNGVTLHSGSYAKLDGYVYSKEIENGLVKGTPYLWLRSNPSFPPGEAVSMTIESDSIRKTLIEAHTNNEWLHIEVSGAAKSIDLPLNGSVAHDIGFDVDNLSIIK